MSNRIDGSSFVIRVLVAGAMLAVVEMVLTVGLGFRDLLTWEERVQAAAAIGLLALAFASVGVGVSVLAARGLDALPPPRARVAVFVAAALVVVPFALAVTEGRRVRDLALRPVAIALAAILVAAAATRLVERVRSGPSRVLAAFFAALVCACALADRFVLPRLYPAFHLGLAILGVASAVAASFAVPPRASAPRAARASTAALVLVVAIAGLFAVRVARAPNTSFVLEARAFVTGKLIGALARLGAEADEVPATSIEATRVAGARGIDLTGRDILLVTVDALRADRLAAYGGTGLTPAMDRLASESAVFTRAYTTTPHTSYALASLLTGKYLRPVFELPNAARDHATLPDRLRRYGYRTAAFYPPAIFFVDSDRFSALEEQGFGFEYRKAMYAPAVDRVRQVEAYLDEAPRGRPVFVWVHFFEPHEPYDPPPARVHGEGDEARYDGEVAEVDAAFDTLVASFRARRPNATVILTADHGEEFDDHGGRYHGSSLYDEQVRVPLVWSSPGAVVHRTIAAPVEHVDIATTLLAALDVPRDARMRGDDLGPLLAGSTDVGPRFAFADIADQRMVVDGRMKAICEARSPRCQLFDLVADPREHRNRAGDDPATLERLRGALAVFTASIPRIEAMALGDAEGFPEELARADLGDRTVAPELLPLLDSNRAEVRAAAARALGRLGEADAAPRLVRLASDDANENVRAEAAIAAFALGATALSEIVRGLASKSDDIGLVAALALAEKGDPAGGSRLAACVSEGALDERTRHDCIVAIGTSHAEGAAPALVAALDDVRLRNDAAAALADVGDRAATNALFRHLAEERYVPSRLALARALFRLGDRRFESATRRYLGMGSGMPGGVGLLLEASRLSAPGARGGDLRGATLGGFDCDANGCTPREREVHLPTGAASESRLVVRVDAAEGAMVRIGDATFGPLGAGPSEVALACNGQGCANVVVRVDGAVRLVGYVLVPVAAEIPVPPPEPWDAGDGSITPVR